MTALTPDETDRAIFRATLADRRRRLAQLPDSADHRTVANLLADVDAALERLERPEFGSCAECDGHVEIDRLRADPTTTVCLDCLNQTERRALEYDLELAGQVQASLLPPRDFESGDWVGHYMYQPHTSVGGDYVDVLPEGGRGNGILVALGDVSGKGVAAALLMSHLHALLRATASSTRNPAEIVDRTNRMLCATAPSNAFVTLVAARLLPGGVVELCTAGHTPSLLVSRNGVDELATDGLPLGLFCEARYTARSIQLQPGEGLVLYSDGVSESADPDGVELGTSGLCAALQAGAWRTPADLVAQVTYAALQHRCGAVAHDDISVMALLRPNRLQ